jgi:glycine cleavage system H protein
MQYKIPSELYYSQTHEWAQVDENLLTLGVTDFMLDQLGEVLYLDLPEEGDRVTRGEFFSTIESCKEVRDLISPVNGMIFEVNYQLLEDPGMLNDDPYGEGWLVRIEIENEMDLALLSRASQYKEKLGLPSSAEDKIAELAATQDAEGKDSDDGLDEDLDEDEMDADEDEEEAEID